MKRHRGYVVLIAMAIVGAGAGAAGCGHSQKRSDWRHPAQVCAADSECPGGKCSMEIGASSGACTPSAPSTLPQLPPGSGDGGARPPAPGPSIQPSSNDIHI